MLATTARETRRWLVDIVDATDPALCGGKAVGLATLRRIGAAVPPAICLTTNFYRHCLESSGLGRRVTELVVAADDADARRAVLEQIRREIQATCLPEDAATVLWNGMARLPRTGADTLSMRSSAAGEDHPDASHAGVHASVAVDGPDADAVIAAIKTCWASLWTEAAWTYRERRGLPHAQAAMGVLVQRFVAAACSGVAFSADPLTNDGSTVVIEAGWGTGAALVAGRVTPDHYRVAPEADVLRVRRRSGRGASPVEMGSAAPAWRPEIPMAERARLAREMLKTFFRTPGRGRRLFRIMRRGRLISRSSAPRCCTRPPCALCTRSSRHSRALTCPGGPPRGMGAERCR